MNQDEKTLYVKLAYQYYQNKEYKRAYELYTKLCQADPEDFNIFNMLGDTYVKAGIMEKAADAYSDTMAILEKKGQYLKIIKLAKKVLKLFPEEPRIKTRLKTALRNAMREAERRVMNREYAGAREIFEVMADFSSDEFPVKAKMLELEKEEAEYEERRKKAAESRPAQTASGNELIERFDRMAQNYIANGDYDGAVETYITALKLAPGNEQLREKLHKVYATISQKASGDKVWEKIDSKPHDRLEEIKRKAAEERRSRILKEEEERARKLMEEEEKIQQEYEAMEAEIIKKAALELKIKLDEAQKKEKLKEEEIERIMKEQEQKKRELLEKIKKEAIEKWKKQKDAIQAAAADAPVEAPAGLAPRETLKQSLEAEPDEKAAPPKEPEAKPVKTEIPALPKKPASLMDTLKKAYETPVIGEGKDLPGSQKSDAPKLPSSATFAQKTAEQAKEDTIMDDIGEVEHKVMKDDIVVDADTLDSLITTAYIYLNQGLFKEALHIHDRIIEKYPGHQEAKQLKAEIEKRRG